MTTATMITSLQAIVAANPPSASAQALQAQLASITSQIAALAAQQTALQLKLQTALGPTYIEAQQYLSGLTSVQALPDGVGPSQAMQRVLVKAETFIAANPVAVQAAP